MSEVSEVTPLNAEVETPKQPFIKEIRTSEKTREPYEFYSLSTAEGRQVKIMFKAPEEMIPSDIVEEKNLIFTGENQHITPIDKYNQWKNEVAEGKSKNETLFITNRSILGILEAAKNLDPNNPHLKSLYNSAINLDYTDEILGIIDTAIAGRLLLNNDENFENTSNDSEALILTSLLGDERAIAITAELKEKYSRIYQSDRSATVGERNNTLERLDKELRKKNEALKPKERLEIDDLIAVHCTKYLPTYDDKLGRYKIRTLFDATNGKSPRTTLHFTLNHPVDSHLYGNWSEMGIVIFAPLPEFIGLNGNPQSMKIEDTYWNLNPGQDIVLPENTTILIPKKEGDPPVDFPSGANIEYYTQANTIQIEAIRKELEKKPENTLELLNKEDEELRKIGDIRDSAANELIHQLSYQTRQDMSNAGYFLQFRYERDNYVSPEEKIQGVARNFGIDIARHSYGAEEKSENTGRNFINEPSYLPDEPFSIIRNKYRKQLMQSWKELPAQQRRTMWTIGLF